MENLVIRLDDSKWKSLMVALGHVNVSSKKHDSPAAFFSAIEKKGLLESMKRIPIAGITQISMLAGDDTIHFEWYDAAGKVEKLKLECSSETDAQRLAEHLSATRGMRSSQRSSSRWKAIGNGVIGLLVTLALTGITYGLAKEIEQGGEVHVSGRKAWLKAILWGIAEMLGPTGTIVAGLLIAALFGWFIWHRLKKPPTELVWT